MDVNTCYVHFFFLYRNSFSQLVGEEFLKFFDFSGDTLDVALRRFVRHLTPIAEPQDRDQLLLHFAQHYHSCNSSQYKSAGNITAGLCLSWCYFMLFISVTRTECTASVFKILFSDIASLFKVWYMLWHH